MDWADDISDAAMARCSGSDEPLEAARHAMANALHAEREACAKVADDSAEVCREALCIANLIRNRR